MSDSLAPPSLAHSDGCQPHRGTAQHHLDRERRCCSGRASSPRGPQECHFLCAAGSHGLICLRGWDFHFSRAEYKTRQHWGSPDGSVAKNLPANARDKSSIPDPGRSRMPQNNEAHAPQLLNLYSRAQELQLLSPRTLEPVPCNKRSSFNEKPKHCS